MHIKRSGDDLFTSFLQLIAENQRLVAETDEDNKVILIFWVKKLVGANFLCFCNSGL